MRATANGWGGATGTCTNERFSSVKTGSRCSAPERGSAAKHGGTETRCGLDMCTLLLTLLFTNIDVPGLLALMTLRTAGSYQIVRTPGVAGDHKSLNCAKLHATAIL